MSSFKNSDLVILSNDEFSASLLSHHPDDQLLQKALRQEGVHARIASWKNEWPIPHAPAYLFRSTWGYYLEIPKFKEFLSQLSKSSSMVWNPISLIRWNFSKRYLLELAKAKLPVIPTKKIKIHPGLFFRELWDEFESECLILKPLIGAGGHLVSKIDAHFSHEEIMRTLFGLMDQEVIVQSFLRPVLDEGEFSLIFIDGEFSHCIQKKPADFDFRCHEKYGAEMSASPCPSEALHLSRKVLNHLPEESLYARIDFIRTESRHFLISELELIEPDLFLRFDPEASKRMAQALSKRL
jgi:glutathione synthase/RimK-type ligase-like ATP-grasp enzyme